METPEDWRFGWTESGRQAKCLTLLPSDLPISMPQQDRQLETAGELATPEEPTASQASVAGCPDFVPALGMSNRHMQTVYGSVFPGRKPVQGTVQRKLRFADGDFAVMHDNRPDEWCRGDHVVLLMHGLSGCFLSGYMTRTCAKLLQRNVRVFRMDHRGSGAGRLLAKNPYNAGRIQDVESAIRMLERLCPDSPVSIAGFSLSGNLLLRYLGDRPDALPMSLYRAVAVGPPIDLQFCVDALDDTMSGRRYSWYFARQLTSQILNTPLWRDDLPLGKLKRPPRRLIDFDELYTAPASGFSSAAEYYAFSSAKPYLPEIRVHTTVLTAEDDPLVSTKPWDSVQLPPNVQLCRTRHGGHLGFIGRSGVDPDNRWMDWRVVDWLLN